MLLTDILETRGIVIRPPWKTFEQAVRGLVGSLVDSGNLSPSLAEKAVGAVCERERMQSTVMVEIGMSVPHARVPGVEGVVAALAVSPTAVYYAMRNVPISIMALVLSSPDLAAEHLNLLADVSMRLQSEKLRSALQHAVDAGAALAILRAQERA